MDAGKDKFVHDEIFTLVSFFHVLTNKAINGKL